MTIRTSAQLVRLLAATIILNACGGGDASGDPVGPGTPPPTTQTVSVSLSGSAATVPTGQTHQLTATVTGTTNSTVTWTSSAEGVATVSAAGVVTGVSTGITTITARSAADPSKFASAAVTVTAGGGTGSATLVTSGTPIAGISGAANSQKVYRIVVPSGATRLEVTTAGGTGDVDVYLRAGAVPANGAIDCESDNASNTESCVVNNPAAGDWYILLQGYSAYTGVTLTATRAAGTNPGTPGFSLAVSPSPVTLARSGSATITVTATRTGGFTGAIALSTEGFATGISGGGGITMAGNVSSVTMVLNASSAVTAGTSSVTVRGKASGLPDATATVPVSVTVPAANPSLTSRTVGVGDGTVSPAGGQYAPGTRLTVNAVEGTYSEFKGWEGANCPGVVGGCILTFASSDIEMVARFEPIVWRAALSLEYQAHLTAEASVSGVACTWTVKWSNGSVEITHFKSGGTWKRRTRVRGHRTVTTSMEGCSNASADIDKTVDEPASGHGVNTTITVAGSSSSSESLSIGMDLNRWPSMSVATLRMEVAGTGRSGGVTVFPVSFTVVR